MAIAGQRVCRLTYISFSNGSKSAWTCIPLRMHFGARAWYLLAWTPAAREVRTYKLGRIRTLKVLDERFEPRPGIDPQAHLNGAWSMIPEGKFFDVRLRFSPMVRATWPSAVASVAGSDVE